MKSTIRSLFASTTPVLVSAALVLVGGLASAPVASGDELDVVECSARTLRGVYQFRASGHQVVNGTAVPKAIIEMLVFDGRGGVLTPAVSISINGFIIQPPQGNPGVYTVDPDCTGTLTFGDGIMFDLHVVPSGKGVNMLQTNPNSIMQGAAERVLALGNWAG